MQDLEHTGIAMSSGDMMDTSQMLVQNGNYTDERFIDIMVPHHQMAIDMAKTAQENAEHPEIKQLSQDTLPVHKL